MLNFINNSDILSVSSALIIVQNLCDIAVFVNHLSILTHLDNFRYYDKIILFSGVDVSRILIILAK